MRWKARHGSSERVARTVPLLRHVRFPVFGPSIETAHQVYSLLSISIAVSLNLLQIQKTSERHFQSFSLSRPTYRTL